MKSKVLIDDLIARTKEHLTKVETLNTKALEELNWKPSAERWSVLECVEHLNLYGDFYIPEFNRRLENNNTAPQEIFKAGMLGEYFAKSMLPKEKLNKMKTFADKNPNGSELTTFAIERLSGQLTDMLAILERARGVSLTKTKCSISISKLIKLNLGDTLRVVIYHNERHLLQAKNVLAEK
jgi:hypothetical protein